MSATQQSSANPRTDSGALSLSEGISKLPTWLGTGAQGPKGSERSSTLAPPARQAVAAESAAEGPVCPPRLLWLGLACDQRFAARFADSAELANFFDSISEGVFDTLGHSLGIEVRWAFQEWSDPWMPFADRSTGQRLADLQANLPDRGWDGAHAVVFWAGEASGPDLVDPGTVCDSGPRLVVLSDRGFEQSGWQLRRALHGLGHSLGAWDTTDFCPPLDECAPLQIAGNCQERQRCPLGAEPFGTLMSACHLCPGGWPEVALAYHPANLARMQAVTAACLFPDLPVQVDAPTWRAPGDPWVVRVQTTTPRRQPPALQVIDRAGAQQTFPATEVEPGVYEAQVPASPCGERLQAQWWFPDEGCGGVPWPHGPLGGALVNWVAQLSPAFVDDGVVDRGLASLPGTASAGFWNRGQPGFDGTWPFAAQTDAQGDGWCYLTDPRTGNSDVDDGSVELVTPWLALPPGPFQLSFEAYLDVVNSNGQDRLVTEVQFEGPGTPWFAVWRLSEPSGPRPTGPLAPGVIDPRWKSVVLPYEAWQDIRPAQDTQVRFRFLVRDGWPPSAVEAGLDGLTLETSSCP